MGRTLPDGNASAAEQRRSDTHVCRAMTDCGFQVAGHARRDDAGLRVGPAQVGGDEGQAAESVIGVAAQRRDRHHATEAEPGGAGYRLSEARDLVRLGAAPAALRGIERHLDERDERSFPRLDGATECGDERQPVNGVHDVGIAHHRADLVALEAADEVPPQIEVGTLGMLLARLLVAVLPHVAHAELGEYPDVARGPRLGDRDQYDVLRGAARSVARGGDARARPLEVVSHLVTPAHGDIQTTTPKRPVMPSRRCEKNRSSSAVHCGSTACWRTPPSWSCRNRPARMSRAGAPVLVAAPESGAAATTSSRISAGTS